MSEKQNKIEEKIQELETALKENLPKEEMEQLLEELHKMLTQYLNDEN